MFMLGRRKLRAPKVALKFKNFQLRGFPPAPTSGSYAPKAAKSLANIYLNDEYGDCVIAWMAHAEGIWHANAGKSVTFTRSQIIAEYSQIGGFDPRNPQTTDNGCQENTALDHWLHNGFCGHKIAGFVAIDATNQQEVIDAVWLFEGVMFGVGLPDLWVAGMQQLKPGFTWDTAGPADEEHGHCFGGVAWGPNGLEISTWGMLGTITYRAIAAYAQVSSGGQLFACITPHMLKRATLRAPNGFDWNQLKTGFASLGGIVDVSQ